MNHQKVLTRSALWYVENGSDIHWSISSKMVSEPGLVKPIADEPIEMKIENLTVVMEVNYLKYR